MQLRKGSKIPVVAALVLTVALKGSAAGLITVGAVHASLAGPVIAPLMMRLMLLTVAPAATAICVDCVGLSGGLVLDSQPPAGVGVGAGGQAPFQKSTACPGVGVIAGKGAGGSSGPTLASPVNDGSMASSSTV